MKSNRMFLTVLSFFIFAGLVNATTYYVDPNGDDDANGLSWDYALATVSKAVTDKATSEGDIVVLKEGTHYTEAVIVDANITITGTDPNDWTITKQTIVERGDNKIDQTSLTLKKNSVITGVTIKNQLECLSSPTIKKCIKCDGASGIIVWRTSSVNKPKIIGNKIYRHRYDPIDMIDTEPSLGNYPIVANNWIYCNADAGIQFHGDTDGNIRNNIFVNNAYALGQYKSTADHNNINNCILWQNSFDDGRYFTSSDGVAWNATYCRVDDPNLAGDPNVTHNITSDPCFVHAPDFCDRIIANSTKTTIIIWDSNIYEVNDVIEYWNDGIARTITNINAGTLTFTPALDANSVKGYRINNWGIGATDMEEDFRLKPSSPCINAGDPNSPTDFNEYNPYSSNSLDFDNEVRAADIVDIGADEVCRVHNVTQNKRYPFIQNALDDTDANDGDIIQVAQGIYKEIIDFKGLNCVLTSEDPNNPDIVGGTVIYSSDSNKNAVTFETSEDANCVITGLTIKGGVAGIDCNNTSPTITKCFIEDNSIGINTQGCASPTISTCIIKDNSQGVVCSDNSTPAVINNIIKENGNDGIYVDSVSPVTIKNNWIYDSNDGVHLYNANSNTLIRNNSIVNNAIYGIYVESGNGPLTSNCIIWDSNDDLSGCSATYSCIQDGDNGTGNISTDPNFIDSNNNDYHLYYTDSSPCIDAGDPNDSYTGELDIDTQSRVDGNCIDIGADEFLIEDCNSYTTTDHFNDGDCAGNPLPVLLGGTSGHSDFIVNRYDLDVITLNWGLTTATGMQSQADIAGDPLPSGPPFFGNDGEPDGSCDVYDQNKINSNWYEDWN